MAKSPLEELQERVRNITSASGLIHRSIPTSDYLGSENSEVLRRLSESILNTPKLDSLTEYLGGMDSIASRLISLSKPETPTGSFERAVAAAQAEHSRRQLDAMLAFSEAASARLDNRSIIGEIASRLLSNIEPTLPPSLSIAKELISQSWMGSTVTMYASLVHELEQRNTDDSEDNSPQAVEVEAAAERLSSELDAKIVSGRSPDLGSLPTWVIFFWAFLLSPIISMIINWEAARAGLVDLNARIPQTSSFYEIRNFIRTELGSLPGEYWIVGGSNAHMREGPSTKAPSIMVIPKNSPVAILNKENRSWVLVSYNHMGLVIDGYVSSSLLKNPRKK